MKSIAYIFIFLAFLLVGCSKNPITQRLADVESVMDLHPDSALMLLDSISQEDLKDSESNALYALLRSQALDKNYIDITNDSLILIAENYYKTSDDLFKLMLSYYYHGRVRYNGNDFPQSLCLMTKAFNCAEVLSDFYWKGRIAEQISNIYGTNYHGKESVYYAKTACDNLALSGKQPYINYALLSLARAYNNYDMYAECNQLSMQLSDSAVVTNDTLLLNYTKELLATSYIGLKDYENAVNTICDIRQNGNLSNDLRCLLGISYIESGEMKKAEELFENISNGYGADDLSLIYEIAKRKGDLKVAVNALSQLYNNLDSVFEQSMNQNFSQSLAELHKYEQKLKDEEITETRQMRNSIIVICIIVITIIIIICVGYYRKYRNKLEKNILIAQNLQEILQLKETAFSEAQHSIKRLLATRFEIIDNLCKAVYENQATGLVKKKISDEIENLIEQFSSDKQKISELERFADKNHSNLISSFKEDLPNLKEADYLLFLYTALGFSITAIALFLKEDKLEAVYNRKARLKTKIRKSESSKANTYIKILS